MRATIHSLVLGAVCVATVGSFSMTTQSDLQNAHGGALLTKSGIGPQPQFAAPKAFLESTKLAKSGIGPQPQLV